MPANRAERRGRAAPQPARPAQEGGLGCIGASLLIFALVLAGVGFVANGGLDTVWRVIRSWIA